MKNEALFNDFMAPDYNELLKRLEPDLQDRITQLPGFDQSEWDSLINNYPDDIRMTPEISDDLQHILTAVVQDDALGLQERIVREAGDIAANDRSLVKADGGLISVPLIIAGTVFSLYVVRCAAILLNNRTKAGNKEQTQDIPNAPAFDLPDFWSVAKEAVKGFNEWLKKRG